MTDPRPEPMTAEDAVEKALLMLLQKRPPPLAAAQVIRWLEQDGYTVAAAHPPATVPEHRCGRGELHDEYDRLDGRPPAATVPDEGLPPGTMLRHGPAGACQWGAHHWLDVRGVPTCLACNATIVPLITVPDNPRCDFDCDACAGADDDDEPPVAAPDEGLPATLGAIREAAQKWYQHVHGDEYRRPWIDAAIPVAVPDEGLRYENLRQAAHSVLYDAEPFDHWGAVVYRVPDSSLDALKKALE